MTVSDDFSERWYKVEALLASPGLGIDANTVMVDIPYWQKLGYPKPQQSLREELEELNNQYLNFPKELMLTPLQAAALFRETLTKVEDLLAGLNKPGTPLSAFHRHLKPAVVARMALTEYADLLRWMITQSESEGSSSRHNATRKLRNDSWRDLAKLWQQITVNAKNKPLRRHRYKFISIVAPTPFAPRSEREVNAVLERRTKRAGF
jgi:hypothetical protein